MNIQFVGWPIRQPNAVACGLFGEKNVILMKYHFHLYTFQTGGRFILWYYNRHGNDLVSNKTQMAQSTMRMVSEIVHAILDGDHHHGDKCSRLLVSAFSTFHLYSVLKSFFPLLSDSVAN